MGDGAFRAIPNVRRLFDKISARAAAQAAERIKERFEWKAFDAEAAFVMFPQNVLAG